MRNIFVSFWNIYHITTLRQDYIHDCYFYTWVRGPTVKIDSERQLEKLFMIIFISSKFLKESIEIKDYVDWNLWLCDPTHYLQDQGYFVWSVFKELTVGWYIIVSFEKSLW